MCLLKIANDFSYLITDKQSLKDKLWKVLRFRQRNYYHSSLYKQKIWDGYVDFFNKKNGRFLTGLIPEVAAALKHLEVDYDVEDYRNQVNFIHQNINNSFLNGLNLYDYQVDLTNKVLKHKRGIIQAPTSAGKTNIFVSIMKCLPENTPTLLLANRKGLSLQNYEELLKWEIKNVGRFDGEVHEPNIITCATVQSLRHIDKLLPKFRALIVDEIHMMMGPQCIKAYKKLTSASVRVAISATPFKYQLKKKSGKDIEGDPVHKYAVKGYFGPVLKTKVTKSGQLTTEYLQDRGNLSGSKAVFYVINEPQIPHEPYIDAVTYGIAQNWYFHQTVARLAKTLTGRTLILVERLAHGDALQQLIPGSIWVQGKDNNTTRKQVIERLQSSTGNVTAIATVGIFNAGINVRLHSLINAAGGQAAHEIIQRIGRGLRTANDKDILQYYDFIFRINQYLEQHSLSRIKILKEEGHDVTVKEEMDF